VIFFIKWIDLPYNVVYNLVVKNITKFWEDYLIMKKLLSLIFILSLAIALVGCSKDEKELNIKMGRLQGAPHGDKSFSDIVVVLDGDKIIAVSLDEYQIGSAADFTGVPNTDGSFGTNFKDGLALFSKRANNETYSANMKSHANATQSLSKSYDAIIDKVVGLKVSELKDLVDDHSDEDAPTDVVAGSTLADNYGYISAIYDVAKVAKEVGTYKVDKVDIKIGRLQGAPHGDKSFSDIVVVLNSDKIIAVSLDEYQIGSSADFTGVPNTDGSFGTNFKDGLALFSKRANNETYSANMKSHANATQSLSKSYDAIIEKTLGLTVEQLKDLVDDHSDEDAPTDVVAGSTLADNYGYISAIYDVAKIAK
jgi:hypothetical protein